MAMASMLVGARARTPLVASDGRSGSALERVTLADGRVVVVVVVVKRVLPAQTRRRQGPQGSAAAA
jgi:hypothetical protein